MIRNDMYFYRMYIITHADMIAEIVSKFAPASLYNAVSKWIHYTMKNSKKISLREGCVAFLARKQEIGGGIDKY